jgi:hypothetical protein
MALRPLACWDCEFESRLGHGCLSLVNVVCCQVEISATGRSLVQRGPTERGVNVVAKSQQRGGLGPSRVVATQGKKFLKSDMKKIYYLFLATCLSISLYRNIFYVAIHRHDAAYIFTSTFLIYCTEVTRKFYTPVSARWFLHYNMSLPNIQTLSPRKFISRPRTHSNCLTSHLRARIYKRQVL